ncbi:MAG: DUF2807 domain-containing protein [Acidobacteria bacterium]|nr:DUF2807 domain-containing protein [Acidobacteriota bacterium]
MKKIGLLIFVGCLVVGLVCANMFSFGKTSAKFFNFEMNFGGVKGSGNVATDSRSVGEFHGIQVGGVYQMEVTAGKEYSVEVTADDNILPLIRTEVSGGILKISSSEHVSPKNVMKIKVTAPDIDSLDVSGVANVSLTGVKNAALSIDSSGASKVHVDGTTAKLTVDVSGATSIDADGLTAENATVGASGASSVSVNVTGNLKSNASGASKIRYSGTTNVESKTTGAGSVSQK